MARRGDRTCRAVPLWRTRGSLLLTSDLILLKLYAGAARDLLDVQALLEAGDRPRFIAEVNRAVLQVLGARGRPPRAHQLRPARPAVPARGGSHQPQAVEGGDTKRAVGLLDETTRIPFAWVKSIPREALPGSLALDNFLLPGNKEDGADKSRHWNVFGGICLYKSPQEALDLALKREMQDFRDGNYSADELREFFRDLIADLNGMYHVMTIDPGLLRR